MTLSKELKWRGYLNQTTLKDISLLDKQNKVFYWGVDPSSDSLTVGNLATAMVVKAFMKHGHKAVLLIGGATGMIGDPDGKKTERSLLSRQEIESNKKSIAEQYRTIFKDYEFELVDNYDWFKNFNYLDFLRDIGKHIPMRQMLNREFVTSRLSEQGSGISYAEFSYVLIQAYDFLWLNQQKGVTLQLAGADQWGNSIAGVDLIRRKTAKLADVFAAPLLVDATTGRKFGKSEEGAIWLDPNKTSPTKFYQFWINTKDDEVEKFLKIFSEFDQPTINEIIKQHQDDLSQRIAQIELAKSVTKLIHGEKSMIMAQQVTDILTGRIALSDKLNPELLSALKNEIPAITINAHQELAEVLKDCGLASSKTEARKLITANAISINGQKFQDNYLDETVFTSRMILIRRGKAFKDSALVILS